jgi:hypothetical protein
VARPVANPAAKRPPGAPALAVPALAVPALAVPALVVPAVGVAEAAVVVDVVFGGAPAVARATEVAGAPKLRTAPDGIIVRRHSRDSPPTAAAGAATGLPAGRIVCGAPNPVARVRLASVPCAVARRMVISSGMPSSAPAMPGLATWAPTRLAGNAERRTGVAGVAGVCDVAIEPAAVAATASAAGADAGADAGELAECGVETVAAVGVTGLAGPAALAGLPAREAAAGVGVLPGVAVAALGAGAPATGAPGTGAPGTGAPGTGVLTAEGLAAGAGVLVAGSRRMVGDGAGVAAAAGVAGSVAKRTTGAGTVLRTSVAGRTSVARRHRRRRPGTSGVAELAEASAAVVPIGGAPATEPRLGTVAESPLEGAGEPADGAVTGVMPTPEGSRRTTGSAERDDEGDPVCVAVGLGAVGLVVAGLGAVVLGAVALAVAGLGAVLGSGRVEATGAATAPAVGTAAGADLGLVDGMADGLAGRLADRSAAGDEVRAVRWMVLIRPASELAPAAWRITRLPADHACRRTVAGASTPPAIRLGPAAATTSGLRTDDSSDAGRPEAVAEAVGRARPDVANRETMLARPTGAAAVAVVVVLAAPVVEATPAGVEEVAWSPWPIGVRRTRLSNRDCCDRSCHDGRATRRRGAAVGLAEPVGGGWATELVGETVADAPLPGAVPLGGV